MRATNCFACRPGALCCPLAAVCKVYFSYLIRTFGCFNQFAKGVMLAVGQVRSEYLFGQSPCLTICGRTVHLLAFANNQFPYFFDQSYSSSFFRFISEHPQ
jgi:hypothetical protein